MQIFYLLAFSISFLNIYCDETSSLYSSNDDVISLTGADFASEVYLKKNTWIVEFYLHWCSHCKDYASTWKSFAKRIEGWDSYLKLGAVDCAESINDKICSHYEVQKYPQLLLIVPNSNSASKAYDFRLAYKVDELTQASIIALINISQLKVPHSLPRLTPFFGNKQVVEDLVSNLSRNKSVIILERPDNYLGAQIVLDMSGRFGSQIGFVIIDPQSISFDTISKFSYLNVHDKAALQRDLEILGDTGRLERFAHASDYASKVLLIRLGTPNRNYMETNARDYNVENVINALGLRDLKQVPTHGMTVTRRPQSTFHPADSFDSMIKSLASLKGHYNCVFIEDLEYALYSSLSQEILRHRQFDANSTYALIYFLNVTALYYPPYDNGRINNFLARLSNHAINVSRSGSLTSEDLERFMDSQGLSTKIFPESHRKWIGCRGSSPQLRGYTCGLWALFHTLTVNAFFNSYRASNFQTINGIHVLRAIREYVRHFFGCRECTTHFLKMAAQLEDEVPSLGHTATKFQAMTNRPYPINSLEAGAPLWLWSRHNMVNDRLSHQPSTLDPAAPKIQFPPPVLCPECLGPTRKWDMYRVLNFLTLYYGQPLDNPYTQRDIMANGRCMKIHDS